MKFPRLILVLLSSVTLLAQPKRGERASPESEKEVLKLEARFLAAVLKSEASVVEPMLAEDFCFVGADGAVLKKAEFLAPIRSGELRMLVSDMSDVNVHFSSADMVVLTYRSFDRGLFKGTEFSGNFRWSDVVVKRNGRWQFLFAQGTPIAAPK